MKKFWYLGGAMLIGFVMGVSSCSSSPDPEPNAEGGEEQAQAPAEEAPAPSDDGERGFFMRSLADCGVGQTMFDDTTFSTSANVLFFTTLPIAGTSSSYSATSDTSCRMSGPPAETQEEAITNFLFHTYAYFEEDAVKGTGDHVQALAQLYQCDPLSHDAFRDSLRHSVTVHIEHRAQLANRYERAGHLQELIHTHLSNNPLLVKSCKVT